MGQEVISSPSDTANNQQISFHQDYWGESRPGGNSDDIVCGSGRLTSQSIPNFPAPRHLHPSEAPTRPLT